MSNIKLNFCIKKKINKKIDFFSEKKKKNKLGPMEEEHD